MPKPRDRVEVNSLSLSASHHLDESVESLSMGDFMCGFNKLSGMGLVEGIRSDGDDALASLNVKEAASVHIPYVICDSSTV